MPPEFDGPSMDGFLNHLSTRALPSWRASEKVPGLVLVVRLITAAQHEIPCKDAHVFHRQSGIIGR